MYPEGFPSAKPMELSSQIHIPHDGFQPKHPKTGGIVIVLLHKIKQNWMFVEAFENIPFVFPRPYPLIVCCPTHIEKATGI